MKELIGKCKNCLGCGRLEDPEFAGTYRCEYAEQMSIEELRRELEKDAKQIQK